VALAMRLYEHALTHPLPPAEREATQQTLSLLYKRAGRWAEAVALWQALAGSPQADPVFPTLELAKYYEHVARDYSRAIALVERLLVAVQLHPALVDPAAVRHRLTRLQRRQA
jgi:hypothetical protein